MAQIGRSLGHVTPAMLRAEGVVDIGVIRGTQIMFVRTRVKTRILHVATLEETLSSRPLDDYARALAVNWIENGFTSFWIARALGVSDKHLATSLERAGYVRMSLNDSGPAKGAIERRRNNAGRRGSRLVKVGDQRYRFASNT